MPDNPIVIPEYVPLDPGTYWIAVAQIWVRAWVFDNVTKTMKKGTGDFTAVGDHDEFKTSLANTFQARYARDRRVRTRAVNRLTQSEMTAGWKAMQHSGYNRAMALMSSLDGMSEALATTAIPILTVPQKDLEIIVVNMGDQGPEGALLLHRWQGGPTGDQIWGGAEDFVGSDFTGSVVDVPGLGIGLWAPKGVALPGQVLAP
jgi:hypothetical protein